MAGSGPPWNCHDSRNTACSWATIGPSRRSITSCVPVCSGPRSRARRRSRRDRRRRRPCGGRSGRSRRGASRPAAGRGGRRGRGTRPGWPRPGRRPRPASRRTPSSRAPVWLNAASVMIRTPTPAATFATSRSRNRSPTSPPLKPKIRMWTSDVAASMSSSIRGKNAAPSISSSQRVAVAGSKSRERPPPVAAPAEGRLDESARAGRRHARDGLVAPARRSAADEHDAGRRDCTEENDESSHDGEA